MHMAFNFADAVGVGLAEWRGGIGICMVGPRPTVLRLPPRSSERNGVWFPSIHWSGQALRLDADRRILSSCIGWGPPIPITLGRRQDAIRWLAEFYWGGLLRGFGRIPPYRIAPGEYYRAGVVLLVGACI